MSLYGDCKTCKEFHRISEPCKPFYTVFDEEYLGEEGKQIPADSFSSAAEKYAAYYNTNNEYSLMGDEKEIYIEFNGERKKFNISAEASVYYSVDEIE